MIAIDTLALIAILMGEPEKNAFISARVGNILGQLSAVSLLEAGMVMQSRRGSDGLGDLLDLIAALRIRVVPYDEVQARLAIEAFSRYGKGMGSTARLNLGDCAAYALAKAMVLPLLFKGDDSSMTDIAAVEAGV